MNDETSIEEALLGLADMAKRYDQDIDEIVLGWEATLATALRSLREENTRLKAQVIFSSARMSERDLMALRATLLEMRSAEKKHGADYMGNLPEGHSHARSQQTLAGASAVGRIARDDCDKGPASRFSVLMEEVGEVADAILAGEDPTEELLQVAAMALAWLGVDYELALTNLRRKASR